MYEGMPDSTLIDSNSIMLIFGCNAKQYSRKIKEIPPPITVSLKDFKNIIFPNSTGKRRVFWMLGDLRNLKLEQQEEIK